MTAAGGGRSAIGDGEAFRDIFFEEAGEHVSNMEAMLLRVAPGDPAHEELKEIFRAAHSIKGSSAMLGFAEIASLTHVLENLLDVLRKGERPLTRNDVDVLLRAGDMVKAMLAFRRGLSAVAPDHAALEAELAALVAQGTAGASGGSRYRVRFGPLQSAIDTTDLETMLAGLADMGRVENRTVRNEPGGEVAFDVEVAASEADLRSIFSLVVPPELVAIERAGSQEGPVPESHAAGALPRGTDPAVAAPPVPPADPDLDLFVAPEEWKARRAQANRPRNHGRRAEDEPAGEPERHGRRVSDRAPPVTPGDAASIRVAVEKVDRLVNLVGELVITEAMLAQRDARADPRAGLADLARHTRNLQEAVMSIRMVPISTVFSRFPRLARELSQRMGKEVELRMSGESTELDRGLVEKIVDPLTHLVRNAIDHGLETADVRRAAGKDPVGQITLAASQRGGNIVIEVSDDGRGLDRARILARAAERGRTLPQDAPEADVWQLVFEAGFSTAEAVTDLSGRGVGMDVVRRNIQLLGGTVDLRSRANAGTTVKVHVPLTLAIIEAMTVSVNGRIYVLPLASVMESRRLGANDIRDVAGQGRTLRVREDYLPVIRLADVFVDDAAPAPSGPAIAVVVESDGRRAAVVVDRLVGQQQVVVKSLEANFRRVTGVSGATIMGDGKVALIVDVPYLLQVAAAGLRRPPGGEGVKATVKESGV